jgi:hypothetical protein
MECKLMQTKCHLELTYLTIEDLLRSHLAAFDPEKHTDVLAYGAQVHHLVAAMAKAKALVTEFED